MSNELAGKEPTTRMLAVARSRTEPGKGLSYLGLARELEPVWRLRQAAGRQIMQLLREADAIEAEPQGGAMIQQRKARELRATATTLRSQTHMEWTQQWTALLALMLEKHAYFGKMIGEACFALWIRLPDPYEMQHRVVIFGELPYMAENEALAREVANIRMQQIKQQQQDVQIKQQQAAAQQRQDTQERIERLDGEMRSFTAQAMQIEAEMQPAPEASDPDFVEKHRHYTRTKVQIDALRRKAARRQVAIVRCQELK